MTRRAFGLAVLAAAGAAVAVAAPAPRAGGSLGGFGSLQAAASSISSGCAKTARLGLTPGIAPDDYTGDFVLASGTPEKPLVSAVVRYVTNRDGTFSAVGVVSSRGQA